jgi:sporulation protein YlmC with PRC-barrel domain
MKRLLIPAAVFALAAPVFGQATTPVQPAQPVQPRPAEKEVATPTFRAKEVLGTKVSITGGTEIGTVEDLVFDDAGNLEYMVVENGGKLITVPWEAAKFDLGKKTAVLGITQETYKTIPTYTVTTYPSFYTPTYRTEVYKVYGLTPRDLRRLERRR